MRIYVGNLSRKTTEPELREAFEKFGPVDSLRIVLDKKSGDSRGFAFVEMDASEHALRAITELHGQEVFGNVLKVSEATAR